MFEIPFEVTLEVMRIELKTLNMRKFDDKGMGSCDLSPWGDVVIKPLSLDL